MRHIKPNATRGSKLNPFVKNDITEQLMKLHCGLTLDGSSVSMLIS